jgi:O-antigen ligase
MSAPPPVGVPRIVDVERQLQNDQSRWWTFYAVLMACMAVLAYLAHSRGTAPFPIALTILVGACLAAFLRPTIGVYLIVFLTLVGDGVTTAWWPFTKNMSSRESILFVSDQLFLNPLEVLIGATTLAWLLHRLVDPTWKLWRGRLFWPVLTFGAFVCFGFLRGKMGGGDTRIAIFEGRALLYVPVVYILITNLLTTQRQYRRLLLLAMVAVSIQSIFSLVYYNGLPDEEREVLESLSEHSATIHMDALFILLIAAWMLRCSRWLRWTMLILVIPVVWAYVLSQRRAAMIALFIGFVALVIVVFYRHRRRFWFVVPAAGLLGLVYVLGTWNATGALGLPAQAVKTVLFPDDLSGADQSSDLYRVIENNNLWFTIRAYPEFGLGFGQKFLRPWPMPDISFFEFWEYLPHNSVLWIWIKLGYLGFVSMLFLFARAVQRGMRSALMVRTDDQAAIVLTGMTYVAMFLTFAYVDIAWDTRSTVFLAFAFALCADFEPAIDDAERRAAKVHTKQLESVMR